MLLGRRWGGRGDRLACGAVEPTHRCEAAISGALVSGPPATLPVKGASCYRAVMLEGSITPAELKLEEAEGRLSLQRWYRRSVYAVGAFVLCCLAVIPFLAGHSLHRYWGGFGKYLILLAMALLIPAVMSTGLAFSTWWYVRSLGSVSAK